MAADAAAAGAPHPDDVDAWLFDLGNVVIAIDFERALAHWAAAAGRDVADLRRRFRFDAAYEQHERGWIDASAYFATLRASLDLDLGDDDLEAGWNAIYLGVVPEVARLLPRLARHRRLFAFTNTNAAHHAVWSARFADDLQPFEDVFLSCDLGLRKPEAEAFAAVAARIGVPLSRILFFDDTRENVDGAVAAGMPAVWVRTPADVLAAVAPYLEETDMRGDRR